MTGVARLTPAEVGWTTETVSATPPLELIGEKAHGTVSGAQEIGPSDGSARHVTNPRGHPALVDSVVCFERWEWTACTCEEVGTNLKLRSGVRFKKVHRRVAGKFGGTEHRNHVYVESLNTCMWRP